MVKKQKTKKTVAATVLFQLLDGNSTTHAKLQALYLTFVLKNGTESRHRRQERERNFDVFDKVSEPSL